MFLPSAPIYSVLLFPHAPVPDPLASAPLPGPSAFVCPITPPPVTQFVPPSPYWQNAPEGSVWYGDESLWTALSLDGTVFMRGSTINGHGFRTKLVYWRTGFDWRKETPDLKVLAKRLDREATLVAAEPSVAVFITTDKPAVMTAINIPTSGCWEIAAYHKDIALKHVIGLVP